MGAIMINVLDQNSSLAFFKANADKLSHDYKSAINKLVPLSNEELDSINTPNFELSELSEETFKANLKAYTFKFEGLDCAYLMLKVLSSENESLWLATELRQFKDSWFFDFADVVWLSLKVSSNDTGLSVEDLKLFPLALFTQFKDIEIQNAFQSKDYFLEKINLLKKHSNWVEHCFDPKKSLYWMWEVSKFGYCLSQYSSEILVQPNSGIKVKNQQLPFILVNDGIEYKALSLAIQVGDADNDDCFWLTTLFDKDDQMKTEAFLLSYGHYPCDLPIRKLIAPNFLEGSVFLKKDNNCIENVEYFLKSLMLEKHLILDYLNILKGVLAIYLSSEFQNRLLYSCFFEDKIDLSRLDVQSSDSLNEFLLASDKFSSNIQIYQSITSFPANIYVPNLKNTILEDIPESLGALDVKVVSDESNIYDEQQPDFNSESRLGVMQTPKTDERYGMKSRRSVLDSSPMSMNAKHNFRSSNPDQLDTVIESNEHKKKHNKSRPVVTHRSRWGLIAKERKKQIEDSINYGLDLDYTKKSNEAWEEFKDTISNIYSDVNLNLDDSIELMNNASTYKIDVEKEVSQPTVIEKESVKNTVVEEIDSKTTKHLTIGDIEIQISEQLVVTLKPYGVVINYPKSLISNDFNYIFNNLIALGVDPYQSRDLLIAVEAPVKKYSYAKALKLVKLASVDDLKLYKGFELYIDLVDRELQMRD